MIRLLRNSEVRRTLLLLIILSALFCTAAFLIDTAAGILFAVFAVLCIAVYSVSTYRRYMKISALASDVNKILHGDSSITLENYSEGELAILHSEIYKMTIRLRDQHERLINDKIYLADSLADISHQIRTPLTSINLLVQLLSEPEITDERRRSLTKELFGLLSRIDWLITALLKISKLDAGTVKFKRECISTGALVEKAAAPLLVPMELRGQELSVNASGMFTGDISWTCEALGNIMKNCTEHTSEGGHLEVTAAENALYTEFVIADNGPGIDGEDLARVFERFYKGKNSGEGGFGIGLALARTIITSQNGTVKAENRASGGACFTVRFYKGTV